MSLSRGNGVVGLQLAMPVLALLAAGPAGAQENLDSGKSGAQLFASDCAICHKTPQTVARGGGTLGLSNFLREHYTASRESAAAISAYLDSFSRAPAPANRAPPAKRTTKGDDKSKSGEKKTGTAKSDRPADTKTSEPKTSEPKTSEPKTSEPKTGDIMAPEPKSPGAKAAEPKAPDAPATKPDKPEKSD